MLTPDYQEFANRASTRHRDNTVICSADASGRWRNQPIVARLPRHQTSTKAELSVDPGHKGRIRAEIAGASA
jgi:hypothetical protein